MQFDRKVSERLNVWSYKALSNSTHGLFLDEPLQIVQKAIRAKVLQLQCRICELNRRAPIRHGGVCKRVNRWWRISAHSRERCSTCTDSWRMVATECVFKESCRKVAF